MMAMIRATMAMVRVFMWISFDDERINAHALG